MADRSDLSPGSTEGSSLADGHPSLTVIHKAADAAKHARTAKNLRSVGIAASIIACGVAAYGIIERDRTGRQLENWANARAVPTVTVIPPKQAAGARELVLPGDVQAYFEAPIYARVSGYLKMWSQDIGAHVKAGQELAAIDAPDLDDQVEQVRNDLATGEAKLRFAELTARRWRGLLSSNAVSQQTTDEKEGDAEAQRAAVEAEKSSVHRLEALENFKRIVAPFDGVVTARNTDVGALINVGSNNGAPLFKVADIHEMRVYVRIPQSYMSQISVGMNATLHVPQYADREFVATVVTTANAVAKESRTVLVELQADNADGKLWPGAFADVHFQLKQDPNILEVPTSAVIFRQAGPQLAMVGQDNKIFLKDVQTGRNLGSDIEILSGVKIGDQVVDNPPETLDSGDSVKIAGNPMARRVAQQTTGR